MDKIIISPAKYIQGNGSLDNIATYAASLGTEPLIIADEFVTGLVGDRVSQSFARENIIADFDVFCGECSQNEISRIRKKFNQRKYNVVRYGKSRSVLPKNSGGGGADNCFHRCANQISGSNLHPGRPV